MGRILFKSVSDLGPGSTHTLFLVRWQVIELKSVGKQCFTFTFMVGFIQINGRATFFEACFSEQVAFIINNNVLFILNIIWGLAAPAPCSLSGGSP